MHALPEFRENAHVSAMPGIDFGENSKCHVRFSYAHSMEHIKECLRRIEAYLSTR
jgi:aspartate/methionine/tyrosine aminotransferase